MLDPLDTSVDVIWNTAYMGNTPILVIEIPDAAGLDQIDLKTVIARWEYEIVPKNDCDLALKVRTFTVFCDPLGPILRAEIPRDEHWGHIDSLVKFSGTGKEWLMAIQTTKDGAPITFLYSMLGKEGRVERGPDLPRWIAEL